jgi:hypothetical protein
MIRMMGAVALPIGVQFALHNFCYWVSTVQISNEALLSEHGTSVCKDS